VHALLIGMGEHHTRRCANTSNAMPTVAICCTKQVNYWRRSRQSWRRECFTCWPRLLRSSFAAYLV
jgi:hypothetical protein